MPFLQNINTAFLDNEKGSRGYYLYSTTSKIRSALQYKVEHLNFCAKCILLKLRIFNE